MTASEADWAELGLAPTDDQAAIRAAYAQRLKQANPEVDPAGFQRLRAAYEAVLDAMREPAHDVAVDFPVAALIEAVERHRYAGDVPGAIAVLREELGTLPPGDPREAACSVALFDEFALQRRLAPALFAFLVDRLEWRDAQGPVAKHDPKRHGTLLARIAAEDFLRSLREAALGAQGIVPRVVTRPFAEVAAALPAGGLNDTQKEEGRQVLNGVLQHFMFISHRFDARALGALREAVEGPPLVVLPPAPPPAKRRMSRRAMAYIAIVVVAGIGGLVENLDTPQTPDTPEGTARKILAQTENDWVSLRLLNGQTYVYFTQLVSEHAALSEIRYGLGTPTPDRSFPVPPGEEQILFGSQGPPIYVSAPGVIGFVSVQLRYRDGTLSPVHTFRRLEP